MATLEQIQAKLQKLQAQADALVAKKSSAIIDKIRELMAQNDLTTADIEAHTGPVKGGAKRAGKLAVAAVEKPAASATGKLPPKYLNPKTGETWSGHARPPAWIKDVKDRSKFLIAGGVVSSAPSAAKPKRTGAYVRGPQPPMYRDPKSGSTWSGRGRAPAWIAEAKDRNKFLIAGSTKATAPATAGTATKAKTAVKKTASKAVGSGAGKGQPKGPQPALYRDPKSGATWSGRGPAPAWLAGAKDRTAFLIAGAANEAATSSSAVTKKTPAKKVGAKKAVTKAAVAKKGPAKHAAAAGKVASRKSAAKKRPGRKTVATEQTAVEKEIAPASVAASTPASE
ncbi:histidine biosynthesis protein HisIE [Trinickia violacea]|uniref:Histidine biosynthesis protein HisIE n=1 Tax=Trinickia violacea TaxID=2571746 RepID=A0A4V1EI43_9BURK|nr:H-NS family nucleoid-associated regulatory protein [Trinickia violacea]QCP52470.1 histidine biosynthesis protein HisIE [Trinickia violacea]